MATSRTQLWKMLVAGLVLACTGVFLQNADPKGKYVLARTGLPLAEFGRRGVWLGLASTALAGGLLLFRREREEPEGEDPS